MKCMFNICMFVCDFHLTVLFRIFDLFIVMIVMYMTLLSFSEQT